MGSYNTAVITTVGQALLTSVLGAQGTMTFTKLQTSSYAYASGTDLSALTSLNNVEQEANVGSATIVDSTHIAADATISNSGISTEYNANTLGIFASDGINEVLFAVSTAVTPDVIPVDQGGTPSTYKYNFTLAVSSTSDITISAVGNIDASDVAYDNTNSWLTSTNVQNAIDEIASNVKRKANVTPSATTVSVSNATPTATVTFTTNSDGAVSVLSSDSAVATASVSGSTVTITGVSNGTAVITISTRETDNYTAAYADVTVTSTLAEVFGVSWDGTSTTAWSRTDAAATFTDPVPAVSNGNGSSPFDEISPWKDIKRVEDTNAGTLVEIPKFYYKWTVSGATLKLQISPDPVEGFSVAPAFMDRGDGKGERDVVYVGAYHCATSTYKSTTGVKPQANLTRATARTYIGNLGTDIYQIDYAMLMTIWMLYLVEYANWNSQATIGYGCGNGSSTENMGSTDGMTYHTGTNAANRTTYGHVRYRYIEDLWGNVYDWCDGIYFSGADIYVIKNPSSFSDSTGGTKVGTRPTAVGYVSAWAQSAVSGYDWFMYPSAVAGSNSTYVPDYCYYSASGVVLCVGGPYGQSQDYGLFCWGGAGADSHVSVFIGSRLMKL